MRTRSTAYLPIVLLLSMVLTLGLAAPGQAVTLQEEVDLGKRLDEEILKQTPLSKDKAALKEMDELGQKLVKGVQRKEIDYHFRIIEDNDLNAFSIPGGYVYFSERFWNVLRRDERIGVLAHEIVHCDRRHALDAISKAQRRQIWLAVLLTAVRANRTLVNVADMAHSLYTLKYSRADEQQADEVGVDLCVNANFNPAGLLLAMRKIQRFQDERGGQPPKVFSSHPPTPERLQYLEQYLTRLGVPVPPENIKELTNPHRVGEVTSVARENTVQFSSSKQLQAGDVVWLMANGWDFHYENRTAVPVASGVVKTAGSAYTAEVRAMPSAKPNDIRKGLGVYDPPSPKREDGIGRLEPLTQGSGLAKLPTSAGLKTLDRVFARQVVWNEDNTKLVMENAGYLVVTDPSSPTGYVITVRPKYSYAPIEAGSALVRVNDPDEKRWLGPVVSIGRGGETIEVAPDRPRDELIRALNAGTRFDVVHPAWDSKQSYADRIAGTAVLKSVGSKVVLSMVSYEPGWNINGIGNGFDIYESAKGKGTAQK